MRPRVFPAEDRERGINPSRHMQASMRPRVFPAEDRRRGAGATPHGRASMRPRVFPAEDVRDEGDVGEHAAASMRPRVFPAEDMGPVCGRRSRGGSFNEAAGIPRGRLPALALASARTATLTGFNEAAGIPRGRLDHRPGPRLRLAASMRPRVFPAED